jgi:hypothetical protein
MIFMTAQEGKQLKHPLMDQWIVYNGTYSALNKKEILPYVTTCMTVKDIILREISQSRKDKHCPTPLVRYFRYQRSREQSAGDQVGRM